MAFACVGVPLMLAAALFVLAVAEKAPQGNAARAPGVPVHDLDVRKAIEGNGEIKLCKQGRVLRVRDAVVPFFRVPEWTGERCEPQ
ncbi:hypothetical protein HYW67_02275 [Candidatus Parcubacteria bacterium]|nr:hypothetical protein [Candidatus Parcubacteria bacterium]